MTGFCVRVRTDDGLEPVNVAHLTDAQLGEWTHRSTSQPCAAGWGPWSVGSAIMNRTWPDARQVDRFIRRVNEGLRQSPSGSRSRRRRR